MSTIPHAQPQPATQPMLPETILEELRGDLALMELHITMLYGFIQRRLGLSREQVARAINEREEALNGVATD